MSDGPAYVQILIAKCPVEECRATVEAVDKSGLKCANGHPEKSCKPYDTRYAPPEEVGKDG